MTTQSSPLGSTRRTWLQTTAGAAAGGWLTHLAAHLARADEAAPRGAPARSVIVLWLEGGPSQLETFDPHPGKTISAGTQAIATAVPGVQLARGLEQVAEQFGEIALVRSLTSKEGDHERGTYLLKTGYRPEPTVVHPALGAIVCHELPVGDTAIPRHISIRPGSWPARGGYLGAEYDAFKVFDPTGRLPDLEPLVSAEANRRRLADLEVVDGAFRRGRGRAVDATAHADSIRAAQRMMSSEQRTAFDVSRESAAMRAQYGSHPFGQGCLAARRLIEAGVRCVEVTLAGWDTHVNNHETHRELLKVLDPAFAALIADLRQRKLLANTLVLCGGEFGRTPQLNRLEGRDHWPHGFSFALAGGCVRGGAVVGATDPDGGRNPSDPHDVAHLHATILAALDIDPSKELMTPVGRPLRLSAGQPIAALLNS